MHYHNETTGLNPWRRAFTLALPVVIAATLFVIPIFFEARLEARVVPDYEKAVPRERQDDDSAMLKVDGDALASLMDQTEDSLDLEVEYDVPNVTVHDLIPSDLRFNEVCLQLCNKFISTRCTLHIRDKLL